MHVNKEKLKLTSSVVKCIASLYISYRKFIYPHCYGQISQQPLQ